MGKRKNPIIEIHPDQIYMTSEQYKAIKKQYLGIPFEIKDRRVAIQLLNYSFIREKMTIVSEEYYLDGKVLSRPVSKSTGKYLLTSKGEYYLDYRKHYNVNHFWNEFRAWITLLIAILRLVVSIISFL